MAQEKPTDKDDHKEKLRAEADSLLNQARNQLAEIQRALGALSGNSALHAKLSAAASHLSSVVSELSMALSSPHFSLRAADLSAIQNIVHSGETSAALAETGAHASAEATASAVSVAATSAETRQETQSLAQDVFDKKIFDPYLQFKSREDEDAYRKREAEAKKYIDAQLAKKTPEGDLNAGGGMLAQMLDAHAHGAGKSPEFMSKWDTLVAKTQAQRAALRAAGKSTEEFDHHVAGGIRQYLKDKGIPETEINKQLSSSANPIDAANSLVKQGHVTPTKTLGDTFKPHADADANVSRTRTPLTVTVADLGAQLKSGGVKDTDRAEEAPAHGLAVAKGASKQEPVVGNQR